MTTATFTPVATFTPTAPPAVPFESASFVYDGDGKRVKSVLNDNAVTTYFVGAHYEVEVRETGTQVTKYYYAGSQRIAMRTGTVLSYLLSDHLGSTSLSTDAAGNVVSELRYKAWGEVRYASGNTPTQYQYTGQYSYASDFGLLFYNARWYDPYLNHFTQPDSIVPDPYNSQDWDRYSYARNNPLKYIDPSGHFTDNALRNYLRKQYGDEWESIWKVWQDDKDWMDMLHGARAGDILSRVWFDSDGNAQINHYCFTGTGDQVLDGLYDYGNTGVSDLDSIKKSSSGVGVVRPDEESGFVEIGHVGNMSYEIHKVSEFEENANYWLYYGGSFLISFAGLPYGIIFGGWSLGTGWDQLKHPDTATMGFYAGDVALRINTFYATGVDGLITEGTRTQWTYWFRGGDYKTNAKSETQIYNPHRNY